jgi:prolyl 4-hydroxylase
MNTFNFIEEYKLDDAMCDNFIKYFKKNKEYNIKQKLLTQFCNNIQYYKPKQGYPALHYERGEAFPARQLVYMLYCNTVTDKGGTEFPYQNITLSAVKGKLVIWPAEFTHPHRGIISNTQEKYIVTGWVEIK